MARRGAGPRFGAVARRLPAIHHQRPGERADPHPRAAAPLVSRRAGVGRRQRHAGQRHRVGVRHSAGPLRARADPLPRAGSTMSTVRCALVAGMISLGSPPAGAQGGEPDSVVYVLSAASRFEVKTGKAGLLGFAGHTHVVRARAFVGRVVYYPNAPAQSRVGIVVPVDSLAVLTSSDTADNRTVTHAMRTKGLHPDVY